MILYLLFELVMYLVKTLRKVEGIEEEEARHYFSISQVTQMEIIYSGEVCPENQVEIGLLHKN